MLTEVSPYSEKALFGLTDRAHAVGYRLALRDYCWCSAQAERWLGKDDFYLCSGRLVTCVDTLPPRPSSYQKPVFLCETRRDVFAEQQPFRRGELLRFIFSCCIGKTDSLKDSPHDNIFLLPDQEVAVVHWLPGYGLWQLHVTEDLPYMINPGTRIFALQ